MGSGFVLLKPYSSQTHLLVMGWSPKIVTARNKATNYFDLCTN